MAAAADGGQAGCEIATGIRSDRGWRPLRSSSAAERAIAARRVGCRRVGATQSLIVRTAVTPDRGPGVPVGQGSIIGPRHTGRDRRAAPIRRDVRCRGRWPNDVGEPRVPGGALGPTGGGPGQAPPHREAAGASGRPSPTGPNDRPKRPWTDDDPGLAVPVARRPVVTRCWYARSNWTDNMRKEKLDIDKVISGHNNAAITQSIEDPMPPDVIATCP